MKIQRLAFIGGGAMGGAMIGGLLARGTVARKAIVVGEPSTAAQEALRNMHGVEAVSDNAAAVDGADLVVLAVKPQIFPLVGQQLAGQIAPQALVLSIMAGITVDAMRNALGHERIVRTIPNTPAQINMGVTAWFATPEVDATQREQAAAVLRSLGEVVEVSAEHYIDMATGLSGSGPGFVFLMLEALIDAGVRVGFTPADARTLALQTVRGSAELMWQTGEHPAVLRNRVTSAGGTTAAGLYELEKGGLRTTISDAVRSAYERSVELGTA